MTYDNSAALTPVCETASQALDNAFEVMEDFETEFGGFYTDDCDPDVEAAAYAQITDILTKGVRPDLDVEAAYLLGRYVNDLLCEAARLQRFTNVVVDWLAHHYPEFVEFETEEEPENLGDIISAEGAPQHDFSEFIPIGAKVDSITIKFA